MRHVYRATTAPRANQASVFGRVDGLIDAQQVIAPQLGLSQAATQDFAPEEPTNRIEMQIFLAPQLGLTPVEDSPHFGDVQQHYPGVERCFPGKHYLNRPYLAPHRLAPGEKGS